MFIGIKIYLWFCGMSDLCKRSKKLFFIFCVFFLFYNPLLVAQIVPKYKFDTLAKEYNSKKIPYSLIFHEGGDYSALGNSSSSYKGDPSAIWQNVIGNIYAGESQFLLSVPFSSYNRDEQIVEGDFLVSLFFGKINLVAGTQFFKFNTALDQSMNISNTANVSMQLFETKVNFVSDFTLGLSVHNSFNGSKNTTESSSYTLWTSDIGVAYRIDTPPLFTQNAPPANLILFGNLYNLPLQQLAVDAFVPLYTRWGLAYDLLENLILSTDYAIVSASSNVKSLAENYWSFGVEYKPSPFSVGGAVRLYQSEKVFNVASGIDYGKFGFKLGFEVHDRVNKTLFDQSSYYLNIVYKPKSLTSFEIKREEQKLQAEELYKESLSMISLNNYDRESVIKLLTEALKLDRNLNAARELLKDLQEEQRLKNELNKSLEF